MGCGMSRELISKATRNEFREVLVGFTLREIEMIFEAAHMKPRADYEPPVSGQRRSLIEQYYANIDFSSQKDVRKLLSAYEELIEQLQQAQPRVINPESVDTTIETLLRRLERDGFTLQSGRFVSVKPQSVLVEVAATIALTEDSIAEHLEKARAKVEAGDHSGAIASAYTLVEEFLKELLRKTNTPFNENEGDTRALYKLVATPLNLDPKGDHLEKYLKSIIDGLQRQIGGLYEVANKASDRHARRYNPAKHHAKLAVNTAFTLCEFLLESYEYQQRREEKRRIS
jgi:hypothetical protein